MVKFATKYSAGVERVKKVVAASHSQVIQGKEIYSDLDGIDTNLKNDIVIQDCKITFNLAGSTGAVKGVKAEGGTNLTIRNCEVIHGTPNPKGGYLPNSSQTGVGPNGVGGLITVEHLTGRDCSSTYRANGCGAGYYRFIESHNARGPFARGQAWQIANCSGFHDLEDASAEDINGVSWPEDAFNVYAVGSGRIRRLFVPFGSIGSSGRGLVIEQRASKDWDVEDCEFHNLWNGAFGAFETGDGRIEFRNMRIKGHMVYSSRYALGNNPTRPWTSGADGPYGGSTNSGNTFCAAINTSNMLQAGLVDAIWDGYPPYCANGVTAGTGSYNLWNQEADYTLIRTDSSRNWEFQDNRVGPQTLFGAEGFCTYTPGWISTLKAVRNNFKWRDMRSSPSLRSRKVRIASYWLDGAIAEGPAISVAQNATLCALPGDYSHDPRTYTWQWCRNGVPISGATNMWYRAVSGDIGSVLSVIETAANDNGFTTSVGTMDFAITA